MPLDDALPPDHDRTPDVDELAVRREQLPNTVRVHAVQRDGERIDDVTGF